MFRVFKSLGWRKIDLVECLANMFVACFQNQLVNISSHQLWQVKVTTAALSSRDVHSIMFVACPLNHLVKISPGQLWQRLVQPRLCKNFQVISSLDGAAPWIKMLPDPAAVSSPNSCKRYRRLSPC